MVYLKVSDGSETRKLQLTPGEVSFDQLRERLATLFPRTLGEGSSDGLSLQYRDTDGDVITLSSDQELQLALSQLEDDGVWKVHIKNAQRGSCGAQKPPCAGQRSKRSSPCGAGSLFQHFFEPSLKRRRVFSSVWDDLEQQLQLLHLLHDEVFSGDDKKDHQTTATGDAQEATPEESSKSETAGNTSTPLSSTEEQDVGEDETVRSKPQAAAPSSDEKEVNENSGEPRWETRRFVTWEPRLHVGPFGFFQSHMTPVVYKVSYKPSSANGGCCSSGTANGEKKTESKEEASPKPTAGAEETEKQASATAGNSEVSTQQPESTQ